MRKSATKLGDEYGLTAQEMNFVLKEEGYLDGEPGDYSVTEKGKKYAEEQYFHRGTGGYERYNAYWSTRTWDESITDELDITDERKKAIRQAISIAKQKSKESNDEDLAFDYNSFGNEYLATTDDDNDGLVVAVGALLLAVSVYGIYKAAPHIQHWWNDKAVTGIRKMKNKIAGKEEVTDEGFETVEEGEVP